MAFEEFKAKGGKFTPLVTLNKSGGFGLSSGMHHRYDLDRFQAVKLYFDKEDWLIGIKLVPDPEEGAFTLKKRPEKKGAYFSAKSFLDAYSLDPKDFAGRYSPKTVIDADFGELFVVSLRERLSNVQKAPFIEL